MFQSTSSPPPPYTDHDPEQRGDHHSDQDIDPVHNDIEDDDDTIHTRRNNIWAHRSPLELVFGILFFVSMIFFLVCFCVTAAIILRSAIRGV